MGLVLFAGTSDLLYCLNFRSFISLLRKHPIWKKIVVKIPTGGQEPNPHEPVGVDY